MKISKPKLNAPKIPQHRLFRRLVKQMIASLLKHQAPGDQSEVMRRLKSLEHKVGVMERAMSLSTGRRRNSAKVEKNARY